VPRVFDNACINKLTATAKLPAGAEARFAAGVRDAARTYARDASTPTVGEVRDEITALYKAAEGRQYERVASLCEELSPQARDYLERRLSRPGPRAAGLKLPTARALRDPKRQEGACEMLARICRVGGRYIEGRMRPSGRQSVTWEPRLHAPAQVQYVPEIDAETGEVADVRKPTPRPPKRDAERRFVMHLQLAWLEATGGKPPATVNPSRSDRPFANMVRECLRLVGAPHVDAVEAINELQRRRKELRRRRRERLKRELAEPPLSPSKS
jgi:hypothetical protein